MATRAGLAGVMVLILGAGAVYGRLRFAAWKAAQHARVLERPSAPPAVRFDPDPGSRPS
jgi:hypothetical protein